jgi:hypothetical protein
VVTGRECKGNPIGLSRDMGESAVAAKTSIYVQEMNNALEALSFGLLRVKVNYVRVFLLNPARWNRR